jgi:hypothetical protein
VAIKLKNGGGKIDSLVQQPPQPEGGHQNDSNGTRMVPFVNRSGVPPPAAEAVGPMNQFDGADRGTLISNQYNSLHYRYHPSTI